MYICTLYPYVFSTTSCTSTIVLIYTVMFCDSLQMNRTLDLISISDTHISQSTATIRVTSLAGRPTAVSTITMVTSPALGTPAAPMLATVAVILQRLQSLNYCWVFWFSITRHKRFGKNTIALNFSSNINKSIALMLFLFFFAAKSAC